ncbi:MAG: hypothetical protein GXY83_42115 [Rhodopirellula sp.]|nr:hypothetical protein [Rhodopirellula sp.]
MSERLRTQIKAGPLSASGLDEEPYADWSARVFTADREKYILLSHTRSLYSVVMFGHDITRDDVFIRHALDSLREFMTDDGLGLIYMNFIAPASASVRFCKALNRSITGSMNELETVARHYLDSGDWAPFDVGFKLNETLLSAIGTRETEGYATPREAFTRLGG